MRCEYCPLSDPEDVCPELEKLGVRYLAEEDAE